MKKNMVKLSVEERGRLGRLRKVDKFHLGRFFVLSALYFARISRRIVHYSRGEPDLSSNQHDKKSTKSDFAHRL